MPIPVESPPPIVRPTRGDSFFDQQGEKIKGPCIQVNRDFGVKGSLGAVRYAEQARFWKNESRSKQFIPRGREKTTVFPRSHADFEGQSLAGPQTQKKLTTESVIETVNSLGQITADLGGQSFIPKTESVTGLREAKSLLTEQIEAFSQGVLELTAGGQLNPQRLKEMSRLDFSGKELGSLQPLVEGLSPKKMAGLRKEIRGLMEKMEENSFDTSKLEEGLEKFFSGKNLNAALLAVAGLTAFASINNLDKRRLKQIGLVLLFAVLTTCCGSSDKTLLSTATATTAAATNTAASTEVVSSPTPEIADIVETPAAATEAVSFIPPNNPPIYQEIGSGGPLPETNPLGAGFNRSRYVLLAHEGVIIDQSQYSSYEELVEAINQQAESKNIDVIQAVSFDGQQTLSMAVRTYADGKRMFIWLADADSKLLGARPDIPPSENFIEGEVVIPKEFKDFQLKIVPGEDNNFYLYLVGVDGKAIAWFWQSDGYIDESSADNQVVNAWHWVDENGVAQFDKNVIFGAGGAQVVDETEKVLLNFDLVKKAWVEALPPLPEQILQAAADLGYSQEYLQSNYIIGKIDKIQIGDLTYPALVGIKKDGTSETLGLKLDIGYSLGEMLVPLDDEEVSNLAQQLDCSLYPGCIYWAHFGGKEDFPSVLFISTGIIKTLDLTPLGLHGILVDVELGITKTTLGNPRLLLAVIQKRDSANPNVNLMPIETNYIMANYSNLDDTTIYSVEQLAVGIPKGTVKIFGFSDYSILSDDANYLKILTDFIISKGEVEDEGIPIIYPQYGG